MNTNGLLTDLKRNPRIELVPWLLNAPVLIALLVLLYIFPEFQEIINSEATNIFGFTVDFVAFLNAFIVSLLGFILFMTCVTIVWREKVPAWLFLVPPGLFFVYTSLFSFVMNNNEYITVNYIYQNLGPELGLAVYLVVAALLVASGFYMLHGFPKLWDKKRGSESTRFRPRILALITLVGFLLMATLLFLLLFGSPQMIFWHMLFHGVDWGSGIVLLQVVSIALTIAAETCLANRTAIVSKFRIDAAGFSRVLAALRTVFLSLQVVLIIIGAFIPGGFEGGLPAVLLSPLSMVTYATCLVYLLGKAVFPRVDGLSPRGPRGKDRRDLRATIVIAPLIWVVLFQPLLGVPPQPALPDTELTVVKNSYATLSSAQKEIFDTYMNSRYPSGRTVQELLAGGGSMRDFSRIACGLLFRNDTGDIDAASAIIAHILPDVGASNFVGCDLVMILEKYRDILAPALVASIEDALVECARGLYDRNERPTYSNIAMMGALVMEWVGVKLDIRELRDAGIRKSWEIYLLFTCNETLSEFNSPTYCGVDMLVLAMWRDIGPTDTMRRMGAIMERALWRQFADFYHPGLKNFAGPYIRAYGMNMKAYYAITGIWIALAIDDVADAPLPDVLIDTYKYGELNFIFPAVIVGHSIPDAGIVERFRSITEPRYLERWLPTDISGLKNPYRVTATVHPDWMMGGVSGRLQESGQFFTGCIHWNSTDGSLAWLLVSGLDCLDVEVSGETMTLRQNIRAENITFYVECYNLTTAMISGPTWDLPGISFEVGGDPSKVAAVMADVPLFEVTHDIEEPVHNLVKVTCLLDELTLTVES